MVKNLPSDAGDLRNMDSTPELGRSPEEGHSNPLQYSCLENLMERGAWQAIVYRLAKSQTSLKHLVHRQHTVILSNNYQWNL